MFLTYGSTSFVSAQYGNGRRGNHPGGMQCGSKSYYLHSRKQTDFYESLPIKRATLFRLVVQNSLFIFLIPLVIEEAIEFVIAQQQISGGGWEIVSSSLWYLLIFAATWLTMALAMIMTGNIIVGILGFGVFASYFSNCYL